MPQQRARRTAAAAAVFAAAATVAAAVPAAAGPRAVTAPAAATGPYRTAVAQIVVRDGPNGAHTATLDTRLYVPTTATAAHPAPAVLMTHGFGLSKDAAEVTATADFLARHGYVVLTWSSQGFGQSSGCIRLDSRDYDVADVEQLIAKVLQPRRDVARDRRGLLLGMIGGSYGGGIVLDVAAVDHRLRAIVPGRTWNDLAYSLDPNNYNPTGAPDLDHTRNARGVFKAEWTSLFFADGNAQPVGGVPPTGHENGGCPQEKAASGDPTTVAGLPCLGFPGQLCEIYARTSATGDLAPSDRAVLDDSSVAPRIADVDAATLLLQGESDTLFNLDDATATYLALRRRGVPVAMTWNSGGHGGYDSEPGECDVYGGGDTRLDHCYLTLRALAWFDHWLRGKPLTRFPGFTYYRDWIRYAGTGPDTSQYGTAPAYPAEHDLTLTLAGSDTLAPPGTGAAAGSASFGNPPGGEPASYTETSNFTAPGSTPDLSGRQPFDPPGEAAAFTSPPLAQPLVSVGIPAATLRLTHTNGQDLVFFGKIYDVAPDGTATLIHRLIAPVRVPAVDVAEPVRFDLLGFAHRFAARHRIRLVLAATDQTSYNSRAPDLITIATGRGSTLAVPADTGSRRLFGAAPAAASAARTYPRGAPALATTGDAASAPLAALAVLAAALTGAAALRRTRVRVDAARLHL